jgi:hypothetical protein
VIVDENGYRPLVAKTAQMLYHRVSRPGGRVHTRHGQTRGGRVRAVFSDPVVATAILDRSRITARLSSSAATAAACARTAAQT